MLSSLVAVAVLKSFSVHLADVFVVPLCSLSRSLPILSFPLALMNPLLLVQIAHTWQDVVNSEPDGRLLLPGLYRAKVKTRYECVEPQCGHGWSSVTTLEAYIDAEGRLSDPHLYTQKCNRRRCRDRQDNAPCDPMVRPTFLRSALEEILGLALGRPRPKRELKHGMRSRHDSDRCEECGWGANPHKHW